MTPEEICFSSTIICIGNLHWEVEQEFLESYVRSLLNPPKCEIRLLCDKAPSAKLRAFVDLGHYEKVQQAIREVNGNELYGERITVSLWSPPFSSTPDKQVHLRQFPEGATNSDVYDLLSEFGTIIGIKATYHDANNKRQQLHAACVTFLTVEQREYAIQMINCKRINENSLLASPDEHFAESYLRPIEHDEWVELLVKQCEESYIVEVAGNIIISRGRTPENQLALVEILRKEAIKAKSEARKLKGEAEKKTVEDSVALSKATKLTELRAAVEAKIKEEKEGGTSNEAKNLKKEAKKKAVEHAKILPKATKSIGLRAAVEAKLKKEREEKSNRGS